MDVQVCKASLWHCLSRRNIRWMNDPQVTKYLTPRGKFSLVQALRYYRRHTRDGDLLLAIYVDGRYVGNCGFFDKADDSAELRIVVGEPTAWGKGIGSVAVGQMLKMAQKHGLQRIWLNVHPENWAARRVYQKHGFQEEGTLVLPDGTRQLRMTLVLAREDPS